MDVILGPLRPDVLYVLDVDEPLPTGCEVRAWRPGVTGISEVLHAHIVDYGYPSHTHDTWTVLMVDRGAIRFGLDRREREASGARITLLPPGIAHDGRPADRASEGFWKRNLYLDASMLPLESVGAAVDRTAVEDPVLRDSLLHLHAGLDIARRDGRPVDPLHADARLAMICERINAHLAPRVRAGTRRVERRVACELRAMLDADVGSPPALADAARRLECSVPHLVRSFTAAFGMSPHAYVIGRRIERSRALLLDGRAVADVAVSVGFYDQAHFTRHFRRHVSVTPGRYAGFRSLSASAAPGGCAPR